MSAIETLGRAGSFVKSSSEPPSGVPALAEPGIDAVIVRTPEAPGSSDRLVGNTENATPVVAPFTARSPVPVLVTVSIWVADWLQPTAPRSSALAESIAAGTPASGMAAASSTVASSGVVASEASASTCDGLPVASWPPSCTVLAKVADESSPEPVQAARATTVARIATRSRRAQAGRALSPLPRT